MRTDESSSGNGDASGRRRETRRSLAGSACVGMVATGVTLLQACGFSIVSSLQTPQDVYDVLDESQYVTPTAEDRFTVIDDAKLRVEHGFACAEAPRAASSEHVGLRVGGFTRLPAGFDGTVFLNGWHLEYQRSDHHVVGLGSSIFNVAQLNGVLVWNAGGVISDRDGDDAYRWCYDYTTVAWKRPASSPVFNPVVQPRIDMQAIHADPLGQLIFTDGADGDLPATIKGKYRSSGRAPRAITLAGFGSSYLDDDHHVLQLAFDLGRPKLRNKRVKWQSHAILKDDDAAETTRAAALASVLTGDSVHFFHPGIANVLGGDATPGVVGNTLQLEPVHGGDVGACLGDLAERTVEMYVTTPPYTWAIPMLTGWDLQPGCPGDEHVRHAGARILDWRYERRPGDSYGTLIYTVKTDFGDQDGFPGMTGRVQVDALGIDLLQPPGLDPGADAPSDAMRP